MNDKTEAMQRKIAGLLAKAERAGSPEEAETFAAKAEQLMVKYAIDAAMFAGSADADEIVKRYVDIGGIYALCSTQGLNLLSKALGTTEYWITGKASKAHTGVIVGYEGDVDALIMLWNSLSLQATTAMQRWAAGRDLSHLSAFEKFNERRTFLQGFWMRAGSRAATAFAAAVKEADAEHAGSDTGYSGGAALALVNRADQVKAQLPKDLRTQKSRTKSGSWEASAAGAAAADNADLGQKRVQNRKTLAQ